jgi:hypothetical protein
MPTEIFSIGLDNSEFKKSLNESISKYKDLQKSSETALEASQNAFNKFSLAKPMAELAKLKSLFKEYMVLGGINTTEADKAIDEILKDKDKLQKALSNIKGEIHLVTDPNEQAKLLNVINQAEKAMEELGAASNTTSKKVSAIGGNADKLVPLRSQIRALKLEMQGLEDAGQEGSKRFQDLEIKAARLTDRMGDQQARIKILSSDTLKFDFGLSAINLATNGYQAITAAMQLFGSENEDVIKAMQKLQAITALTNSLKEIQNLLLKEGTFLTAGSALANNAYAASQRVIALAVGTSTGAMKAFKLALLATGVGALIVGLGFLVAKLSEVNKTSKETAESQKNLAEFNKEVASSAGKEITQLDILRGKIENVNLPMGVRLGAIKDIKKEFPTYFDGLSNEALLAGKVADAYDKASAAIIRKATANAASKQLEALADKKFALERKQTDDENKFLNEFENARATSTTVTGGGFGGGTTVSSTKEQEKLAAARRYQPIKEANRKALDDIKKDQDFYTKKIFENTDLKTEGKTTSTAKSSTAKVANTTKEVNKVVITEQDKLNKELERQEFIFNQNRLNDLIEFEKNKQKILLDATLDTEEKRKAALDAEQKKFDRKSLADEISYENFKISTLQKFRTKVNVEKQLNDAISNKAVKTTQLTEILNPVEAEKAKTEEVTDIERAEFDKKISELELQIAKLTGKSGGKDKGKKSGIDNFTTNLGYFETIFNSVVDGYKKIADAESNWLNKSVEIQRQRYNSAYELAKLGNSQYLAEEEKRLRETEKRRDAAARKQLQLDAILQGSQILLAAAGAAAQIAKPGAGPAAVIGGIAAIIGAIASGIALAKQLQAAQPKFKMGTDKFGSDKLSGGYDTPHNAELHGGEGIIQAYDGTADAFRPTIEFIRRNKKKAGAVNDFVRGINGGVNYKAIQNAVENKNYNLQFRTDALEDKLTKIERGLLFLGQNIASLQPKVVFDEQGLHTMYNTLNLDNLKKTMA